MVAASSLSYDGGTEHRGVLTSMTATGPSGAITGSYDADGALTSEVWPNGVTRTWFPDQVGGVLETTCQRVSDMHVCRSRLHLYAQGERLSATRTAQEWGYQSVSNRTRTRSCAPVASLWFCISLLLRRQSHPFSRGRLQTPLRDPGRPRWRGVCQLLTRKVLFWSQSRRSPLTARPVTQQRGSSL